MLDLQRKIEEEKVALQKYVDALERLYKDGDGRKADVKKHLVNVARAHKEAEASLNRFKLEVYDKWLDGEKEKYESVLPLINKVGTLDGKVNGDMEYLVKEFLFAIKARKALGDRIESYLRRRLFRSGLEVPDKVVRVIQHLRRSKVWAGIGLIGLVATGVGFFAYGGICALLGGVAWLVENFAINPRRYPGAGLPSRVAKEIDSALDDLSQRIGSLEKWHSILDDVPLIDTSYFERVFDQVLSQEEVSTVEVKFLTESAESYINLMSKIRTRIPPE